MKTQKQSDAEVDQSNAPVSKLTTRSVGASLGQALAVVGLLLTAPFAQAQTKLTSADNDFILAAAQGGMTEVKLGELAAQKGTRADVKAFGQLMVTDHTAINGDLTALAAQKGVMLLATLDPKHQGMVDKMTTLTITEFDDAYIAAMVKDHEMDAKEFKAESATTTDAEIKAFVDKSIPVVAEHLKRVTALKK